MPGAVADGDLDYKPVLNQRNGEQLPDSVARATAHGNVRQWSRCRSPVAVRLRAARRRRTGSATLLLIPRAPSSRLCVVRSMSTDAINHDPAITFFQSGSQIAVRRACWAWIPTAWAATRILPAFVVLITRQGRSPLYSRSGQRIPAVGTQGAVPERRDALLYLANPDGVSRESGGCCWTVKELHVHAAEHPATPMSTPHRSLRDGLIDQPACRVMDVSKERHTSSCTGRLAHSLQFCRQLPAGARLAEKGFSSSSSITRRTITTISASIDRQCR